MNFRTVLDTLDSQRRQWNDQEAASTMKHRAGQEEGVDDSGKTGDTEE